MRGPLHGVPVGIKDLVDVAGAPTTASSRVLQKNVATGDADIVARLRAAGAVVLGKTNLHEFAYGVVSAPTRNPWDLDRIPGGSSGGSAAALAARTCAGALGSDTAGSIRIPSALCGTSGLVPRPGLLPMSRVVALAPSLDRCGPMARSVRDLELLWEGLCGRRAELPDARGLRLAVPEEPVATVADAVGAALEGAVGALSGAGVRVRTTSVGRFERWDRPRSLLLMTEALAVHVAAGWYPARSDDYGPETLASLRYAERIAPEDLGAARRTLDELRDELVGVFDVADVLVLPSAPRAAPAASHRVRTAPVTTLAPVAGDQ
jgi:aspartyl-tRNA(Asn)/glutamyl-tRNA(Gln) amidotransferase subunit A